MASNDPNFSVLDMAQDMADASGVNIKDFFTNHPVSGKVKAEVESAAIPPADKSPVQEAPKPERKPWTPSAEVMADLPELQHKPVVYDAADLEVKDEPLRNIVDDEALQESREAMDEMTRKQANIEEAKARHGFETLQIPPGQFHADIFAAAGDTDHKRAQAKLDEIFNLIKSTYPNFIRTWLPGFGPNGTQETAKVQQELKQAQPQFVEPPASQSTPAPAPVPEAPPASPVVPAQQIDITVDIPDGKEPETAKVIIDKSHASQVAWSPEEVEKIRKVRTVELNIVEGTNLKFSEIEDVPQNAMDQVLSQYQRKTNDIVAALPASKYRATFFGLSYPEVLDLSNSVEMNDIDGERAKWTICFNHIKNQSIGPWKDWYYIIDRETEKEIRLLGPNGPLPDGYVPDDILYHSKFDDFMEKTSFIDLEFMLWKILCATAMETELISIDCHALLANGTQCNKNYDWIYSPNELLVLESVNPAVLDEMKVTGEVNTADAIMKNWMSSPVMNDSIVELPSSGYQLVFGHISGSTHINGVYGDIKKFENEDAAAAAADPSFVSRGLNYTTLTVIKGVLLPKANGSGWYRITGSDNIVNILQGLNEVDWQVCSEVVRMMIEPYQFEFALRDIVCPACGNRSSITIDNMSKLLFIVARSLSSVQVELKRT